MTDTTREAVARAMEAYDAHIQKSLVRGNYKREEAFLDAINAALAALRPAQDAERVVHLKRGSTYEVIGEAELQSMGYIVEGAKLTVYRCETDGRLWVRPTAEFRDGRFAAAPPRTLEGK